MDNGNTHPWLQIAKRLPLQSRQDFHRLLDLMRMDQHISVEHWSETAFFVVELDQGRALEDHRLNPCLFERSEKSSDAMQQDLVLVEVVAIDALEAIHHRIFDSMTLEVSVE